MKTPDELANRVSRWILREDRREWRNFAYIIANAPEASNGLLRRYLLSLIEAGDSPGVHALREDLGEQGLKALSREGLPWDRVWSFVGIDLCVNVGALLGPGEHARLRERLEAFQGLRGRFGDVLFVEDEAVSILGREVPCEELRRGLEEITRKGREG